VPKDRPAIGNLMTVFNFRSPDFATLPLSGSSEPRATARTVISYRLR